MTSPTERLLALLSLLQARRDWPGALLAERLAVSDRTVRRDVDRLRELGYRIQAVKGPDGGYRLQAGSELPPLLFDDEQAVALAIALRTATAAGAGIGEDALRALATVRQVLPARLRHRVDALEIEPLPPAAGAAQADPAVLLVLAEAVRARTVLRFEYGEGAAEAPRRAEPHHVVAAGGRWYLVAWDLDRADWRTYRADRIRPRSHAGARFVPREVPGGDVHRYISARFRGAEPDTGDGWPCTGSVVLALPERRVRPFAGDGAVEPLDAQSTRLTAGAWSWGALAAGFGRFEVPVTQVEPPELAAAFAEQAERFAAAAGPRT